MPARFPADCPTGFISRHFVILGDTMSSIAKQYGTTEEELIVANPHILDPNLLFPGDVLCVPGFRKPVTCPLNFQGRYEVQIGDTMNSIAKKFNISVDELITANPHIPNPQVIFPFDILCVP